MVLYEAFLALLDGAVVPEDFNWANLFFLLKDNRGKKEDGIREPAALRNISLPLVPLNH